MVSFSRFALSFRRILIKKYLKIATVFDRTKDDSSKNKHAINSIRSASKKWIFPYSKWIGFFYSNDDTYGIVIILQSISQPLQKALNSEPLCENRKQPSVCFLEIKWRRSQYFLYLLTISKDISSELYQHLFFPV